MLKAIWQSALLSCPQVWRACEELLDLVTGWPRENVGEVALDAAACAAFRADCSQRMYQVDEWWCIDVEYMVELQ